MLSLMTMIKHEIEQILGREVNLVHPKELKNGDYTLIVDAKTAEEDFAKLHLAVQQLSAVKRVELTNSRFINIYLSENFFKNSLQGIIEKSDDFGKTQHAKGYKVMVEHTDPNYFKKLHIGHFMPMTIGSSLANIFRWNGAEVKEACYYSDVGLQAAKAVWGMMQGAAEDPYVFGTRLYDEDEKARKEITEINKKIYEQSDPQINALYKIGSAKSVDGYNEIYKKFGIHFDLYFYESEAGKFGAELVRKNTGTIFEESEGAVVFKGSHTRVFINSQGLPTYESKDLGLPKLKFDKYPYDLSFIVTANEQKEYFKVLLEALKQVDPNLGEKTKHISHGTLRLTTGKMSSRTGQVILAEDLIENIKEKVKGDEQIAVAAIKYMILRQSIGNDIIFDFEKSVSTEGDSGVYLQYAHARACSVLDKAEKVERVEGDKDELHELERLLYRFPEIVERAGKDYAPNYITTYLTELASSFNNFYAHNPIIGNNYRLAITKAFQTVMKNGLSILGIAAPERM